jgi:diaminobutyrate-2-oxoglutarate transaminase
MMRGVDVGSGEAASAITEACFAEGLIIETSGAHDEIVKVLAPLTIDDDALSTGLDILENSVRTVMTGSYGIAAE